MKVPVYVNQGTDARAGGVLGHAMAWLQWRLSFHSTSRPRVWAPWRESGGPGHVALLWPPFLSLALPKKDGSYATFRIGWRHDGNWGDESSPDREYFTSRGWPPGGYIFDVIVKGRMPRDRVVVP